MHQQACQFEFYLKGWVNLASRFVGDSSCSSPWKVLSPFPFLPVRVRNMDIPEGRTNVVVVGGVGGCCTALALARTQQFQIYLLEKNGELMRESSDVTPGRMGLGFHYADKETALYYLHATLEFTRKYGRFRQEVGRSETLHPLRRGRYFYLEKFNGSCQGDSRYLWCAQRRVH